MDMQSKSANNLDHTYARTEREGMETPRSNEDKKFKIPRPPKLEEPKPPVNDPGIKDLETEEETEEIPLDFESAITKHTVSKPVFEERREDEKQLKTIALAGKPPATEKKTIVLAVKLPANERKTTALAGKLPASESKTICLAANPPASKIRERKKTEHMKRGDIINCHCGYRGQKSLMVQCDLCLCWQHATCHNMQRECDVPLKYKCSICLNPPRGRRSQRFLHDQDHLYEGRLPGGKPCDLMRRSHELTGTLLKILAEIRAFKVQEHLARLSKNDREPETPERRRERSARTRCYLVGINARLNVIEKQIEELEARFSSEDDEPLEDRRVKETILMLMRDLEILEELGRIT